MNQESPSLLSLVIPVFNESEALEVFLHEVGIVFTPIEGLQLELIFVNDGSTDDTLHQLLALQQKDHRITIVDLSRNFGKESAMTAGLDIASGEAVVPIDVDLQDPLPLVLEMVKLWRKGFDVVLGRRINRDVDSWAKRTSAHWFYRIQNRISNPKLPESVGDFRLMDRKVVEALKQLPESQRFMKGLFAWIGFKTVTLDYVRTERTRGSSKFNTWKLWNFALEGITSFSTDPLRIWTYIGLMISLMSFGFALFILFKVLILGIDVPGYASLMVAITFLGGLQLVGIGILGEYLGRTYLESKRRPIYVVREIHRGTHEWI
ncbi:MAG: glycosyltransferase [Gammaproteobacteria bacterium]|nr:glycosyltransferase [Gammaproteobacteria bacterium]NBT45734.1 glycosyltransferase [Gammaproteobacteria bacterium]